jgi:molybdate transport system permease protein
MDLTPLWLSLRVASIATVVATIVGTLLGYLLAEGRWRGRSLVETLVTLPLILPPTVLGFYLLIVLSRQSVFGAWIERVIGVPLVFTWQAAVVAATVPALPYVVRTARAAFESLDPSIREAASIDGARGLPRLILISLPLARRGIIAGVTLAFARALGEFGATLMVAGNIPGRTRTMPIAIYDAVQAGSFDRAGVLVAILTAVALIVLLLAGRLGAQP